MGALKLVSLSDSYQKEIKGELGDRPSEPGAGQELWDRQAKKIKRRIDNRNAQAKARAKKNTDDKVGMTIFLSKDTHHKLKKMSRKYRTLDETIEKEVIKNGSVNRLGTSLAVWVFVTAFSPLVILPLNLLNNLFFKNQWFAEMFKLMFHTFK